MKTQIKRLAQFLFDNAETTAMELKKTNNYRSVNTQIDAYSERKDTFDVSFTFYDEVSGHQRLKDDYINRDGLRSICNEMNRESGGLSKPKPIEVRDTLEPTEEGEKE